METTMRRMYAYKKDVWIGLLIAVGMLIPAVALAQVGTVLSEQKISDTQGDFSGILDGGDFFGSSVATLGDLDGDGVPDVAVGASLDDDGGSQHGAVWILFLNADGIVKSHQKISQTQGNFTGLFTSTEEFGSSVANLGDLDGDGVQDVAVGALGDDDGGANRGAVWLLFLNVDGTVKAHQKISDTQGSFTGVLDDTDFFGGSIANLGDLDGDGVQDVAVGANRDDDGGGDRGAVWVLFLNTDGTVKAHQKISDTQGSFGGVFDDNDQFGFSVTNLGDLDGDGAQDVAVGARRDDDGAPFDNNRGAVWVLFLEGPPNDSPIADAGVFQRLPLSSAAVLDGSSSSDPDGDVPLTFEWTLLSQPFGSIATLSDPTAVNPSLTLDVPGEYLVELVVTDSLGAASNPDIAIVHTLPDPSTFGFGENMGWVNSRPLGDAGPGMDVSDTDLVGYLWVENLGWINLSCANTSSCGTVDYNVSNDGSGNLAGFGWAENGGWVNFSCTNTNSCATVNYGVTIDTDTGDFSGEAWSENRGWIRFGSTGPIVYGVNTSWRPTPPLTCPECDLSGDGVVDFDDLVEVSSCIGQTAPLSPPCDVADVNGDGIINFNDVSFIIGNFT